MANENINYDGKVSKMVEYAYAKLKANDYYPYYLYRQKNICDGQENIGYCIKGHQCVYNIDSIEEKTSIIAIGSGAISKKVCNNGEIIRQNNSKDLIDYIIVHELCHSKFMNHKPQFWKEVEKYCPNYKILRQKIKEYSFLLKKDTISF